MSKISINKHYKKFIKNNKTLKKLILIYAKNLIKIDNKNFKKKMIKH